ncbi:MAG: hypothetical protein JO227_01510, partial [Acetobacteraceae bacterium]|nr:hypothetical protein [Acetobacteraceae bacterium]
PDLPTDVQEQRALLTARARARRGDTDGAIAAIAALDSAAADLTRADILEQTQDWAGASQALSKYVERIVPPSGPLDDSQRQALIRLATAATRAGQSDLLGKLRQQDGQRIGSGPSGDLFRLLTAEPVRSAADLQRARQETILARGLPQELRSVQPPR